MQFYYMSNTCALATHLALEHAGAKYELIRVEFAKQEQRSAEYLRINPKARVPALVTDRGVLTETPALLAYVAQTYPAAKIAPINDPFAFAKVQAFNSYLCSTVHVAHAHRMRGYRWSDDPAAIESMKKKVPESVGACFELIEREMLTGPWVMGADYTICDMYLFTLAQWLEADSVDVSKLPKVLDHRRRMLESPVVTRTIASEFPST
jgi:glutathione S-transferase